MRTRQSLGSLHRGHLKIAPVWSIIAQRTCRTCVTLLDRKRLGVDHGRYLGLAWLSVVGMLCCVTVAANTPPTVSLISPTDGTVLSIPVPIALLATAADADGSVTNVSFFAGATLLGNGKNPGSLPGIPWSFIWTNPPPGKFALTAQATDNLGAMGTSAVVNITIRGSLTNIPPTVSLISPTNQATFDAAAPITFSANAADSDGTIALVEFLDGTNVVGQLTNSPYTLVVTNLFPGPHSLAARATDDSDAETTSASVNILIRDLPPPMLPEVKLTHPLDNGSLVAPASLTLSASATMAGGKITMVEFFQSDKSLGKTTDAPYQLPVAALDVGVYTYTARATADSGALAYSAPATIIVGSPTNSLPPALRLESPALTSDGRFTVRVPSAKGNYLTLDTSPDLALWYPLQSFRATNDPQVVSVPLITGPGAQFYRVEQVPASDLPNPLRVLVFTNPYHFAQALAGYDEDVTLSLTNDSGLVFSLTAPTNSFFAPATLQMTEVSLISGLPLSGGLVGAVQLTPPGLALPYPLSLTVQLPGGVSTNQLVCFSASVSGADFHFLPYVMTDRSLTLEIPGAGIFGVGLASATDIASQANRAPAEPTAALDQILALADLGTTAPVLQGLMGSRDCSNSRVRQALLKEYSRLRNGEGPYCDYLDPFARDVRNFGDKVKQSGCSSFGDPLVAQLRDYMCGQLLACAQSYGPCARGSAPNVTTLDDLASMVRLIKTADLFCPGPTADAIYALLEPCLRFKLHLTTYSKATGKAGTVTATLTVPDTDVFFLRRSHTLGGVLLLNYKSPSDVTWPPLKNGCGYQDERTTDGSSIFTLYLDTFVCDSGNDCSTQIELVLNGINTPAEYALVVCTDPPSSVPEDSLFWYTGFAATHPNQTHTPQASTASIYVFDNWAIITPFGPGEDIAYAGLEPVIVAKPKITFENQMYFQLYYTPGQ